MDVLGIIPCFDVCLPLDAPSGSTLVRLTGYWTTVEGHEDVPDQVRPHRKKRSSVRIAVNHFETKNLTSPWFSNLFDSWMNRVNTWIGLTKEREPQGAMHRALLQMLRLIAVPKQYLEEALGPKMQSSVSMLRQDLNEQRSGNRFSRWWLFFWKLDSWYVDHCETYVTICTYVLYSFMLNVKLQGFWMLYIWTEGRDTPWCQSATLSADSSSLEFGE